ncbi:MAG: hypothetical protein BIFFINMI_02773 [Phycisphaerae bacterium]|nr:hypothetical protein [Phycisphaerae bacterium]
MIDPELDLLDRLHDQGVEFVIVGGTAAILHGSSLYTEDVDVAAPFTPENMRKLLAALGDVNPVHRMTPQRKSLDESAQSLSGFRNLYLGTDLGELDVLGDIAGLGSFEEVRRNSVAMELDGRAFRVISLEALIKSKSALGRPKDRQAVIQLEAILAERKREPGHTA